MQNEENKYIANIKVIKDLTNADFDIIKGIVKKTLETQDLTNLKCEAFDSYLVIKSNVTKKELSDYLSLKDKSCVYVFKMTNDWNVTDNFDDADYCAKRNDERIKIFKKNKILYAGKSYKAIERVHQHYSNKESKPYSLKLGYDARKELQNNSIMILFFLKEVLKEYKQIILPMMEEKLHIELKPLTGSPRI